MTVLRKILTQIGKSPYSGAGTLTVFYLPVRRYSVLSRHVHACSVTLRTLERYKIKTFFNFTGQDWGSASKARKRQRKKFAKRSKR